MKRPHRTKLAERMQSEGFGRLIWEPGDDPERLKEILKNHPDTLRIMDALARPGEKSEEGTDNYGVDE